MNYSFNLNGFQANIPYGDIDSNLTDKEFSDKYISDKLSIKEKKDFYNSVMDNDLEKFKSFVFGTPNRPPYDIFEEVSQKGYRWTVFHYAMHYGKLDLIKFIIGYLYSQNKISIAFKLKSNDGRCPLLCLLKSKALKPETKVDVFNKIISTFSIPISEPVKERLEIEKNRAQKNLSDSSTSYNSIQGQNQNLNSYPNQSQYPNPFPNQNPYPTQNPCNPIPIPNSIPVPIPAPSPQNPYPESPYVLNTLTTDEKMELHNAAKDDDIDRFRILLCGSPTKKPYPIFEEVSAKGFRWTCIHYAFHYGSWNCIRYILDYLTP